MTFKISLLDLKEIFLDFVKDLGLIPFPLC